MYRSETPPAVRRMQFYPLAHDRKAQLEKDKEKETPEARRQKLRVIEGGAS